MESYLLKFGDSIKLMRLPNPITPKKNDETLKDNFFDVAGLWEGTDITIQKIREKAWRKI